MFVLIELNLFQHPCASKYSGRMGQGPIFRNIQFSKDFPFSCCCFSCCWLQISPWPRPTWTHGLTPDCKWLQMITDLTPQSSPWPSLTWTTAHTHNWLQAITSDKRWLRRNFLQMITDLIPPSPPWHTGLPGRLPLLPPSSAKLAKDWPGLFLLLLTLWHKSILQLSCARCWVEFLLIQVSRLLRNDYISCMIPILCWISCASGACSLFLCWNYPTSQSTGRWDT